MFDKPLCDFLPSILTTKLIVDIGCGRGDSAHMWLKSQFPEVKVLAMDPYARSRQHNLHAFQEIKQATGADVVTSISVLNVIRSPHARTLHYLTLLDACRPGGVVMMKVWAGAWPRRGSGIVGGKFPQKLTNSLCSASHLALTTMNLTNPLHPSHIKSSTKIEKFFRLKGLPA